MTTVVLNPNQAIVKIFCDDAIIGFGQVDYIIDEGAGTVMQSLSIQDGNIPVTEACVDTPLPCTLTTLGGRAQSSTLYTNAFGEPFSFTREHENLQSTHYHFHRR